MKPTDIAALAWVSDPELSPDGNHVAYVVNRIDEDKNEYRRQVWVVGTDGTTPPRALTAGDKDGSPRWSPDGRQLSFVSTTKNDEGKKESALRLLPFDLPGETVTMATSPEGISGVAWSPDGSQLAFTTRTRADHYEHDEAARRPARKIEHLGFALNGEGFTLDRPNHVYVVPTDGSADMRNVTPGSFECAAPSWFPDGSNLAVTVDQNTTVNASDIGVIDLSAPAGEGLQVLTDASGVYTAPTVNCDGSSIIIIGNDDATVYPQNCHIGVLDASAGGMPTWVSTAIDRTWRPFMAAAHPPKWASDGAVIVGMEDSGSIHLYRIPTGDPELVVGGDISVTGWTTGTVAGADAIAYTATDAVTPAELFLLVDGETRQLTSVSHAFVAATSPQPAEHFLAKSGDVEVDAWIVRPHDFDPAKKYPTLLNIHGGPFTQYGHYFFDEFQMQADAGFVVLFANPRGGSGRDTAWVHAVLGPKHRLAGSGWGALDYEDCMAVVDTAIDQFDFVDADRLGVLGGSYGGYMTSWIVTHTDRFAAACSERAVNNLLALEYASDLAGFFSSEIGPRWVDDPDEYMRMSPITYVKDLNTPLLIVHSEDDLRCPADQATQLFVACQLLDKPDVEYWLFPGENHEMSRSGSPFHRKQRAEIILDFFGRHLQP